MNIRSTLLGSCDAALLALMGVLQISLLFGFAGDERREPPAFYTEQAHVEVIVVEARKISRG